MPVSSLLPIMQWRKIYLFLIISLLLVLSSLGQPPGAGTPVSLLCMEPRPQAITSHILLLVQVIIFLTKKTFESHNEYFYFN